MNDYSKAFKAAAIISELIENSDSYITELLLDDYGRCIHLSILSYGINTSDIEKIGEEFGDSTPNLHPVDKKVLKIVFCNERHEELYTIASSNTISINPTDEALDE